MRFKQGFVACFSALLFALPAAAQDGKLVVKTYNLPSQSFFETSKRATLLCEEGSNRLIHGTVTVGGMGLWAVREQAGYGAISIFQSPSADDDIVTRITRVPHELCEGNPDAVTVVTSLREAAGKKTSTAIKLIVR
jgi:hypothetical protein